MSSLKELEEQVLFGARMLAVEIDDVWGHVTCRLSESDPRQGFLLKHLRIPPLPQDPDEVMVWGYDGKKLSGQQRDPWEIPLYTAVYLARPDVQSVIHIHPPVATALSATGRKIHAVSHEGWQFGEGLPVFTGEIIDTDELGRGMMAALGQHHACMLSGHGAVIVGTSVPDAVVKAAYLERTAKQMVWASALGTPEVLAQHIREYMARHSGLAEPPALWRFRQWQAEQRRS